jgi:hypothetical protein
MTKVDMAFFPSVEGAMTSEDGQTFMLHVKRPTGADLLLGFPHKELPKIWEFAAVQSSQGKDASGKEVTSAFETSSFELGVGPSGEHVLTMIVGPGIKLRFLLPASMSEQLSHALQRLAN